MLIKKEYDGIRIGDIDNGVYQFLHFETCMLYTKTTVYLADEKITFDRMEPYTLEGLIAKYPEIVNVL